MRSSLLSFPTRAVGLRLHVQLRASDDPTVPAEICSAYLPPLLAWLGQRFRHADPHLIESAAHEALLGYLQNPQAYDRRRSTLHGYLQMAAWADLQNLLRREQRHHRKRICWNNVEDGRFAGKLSVRDPPLLEREEERQALQAVIHAVAERLPAGERALLERMLDGNNDTEGGARALGLGGLPVPQQQREVKRARDRLVKRLRRWKVVAPKRGGNGDD